jgi:hypothetical protein
MSRLLVLELNPILETTMNEPDGTGDGGVVGTVISLLIVLATMLIAFEGLTFLS